MATNAFVAYKITASPIRHPDDLVNLSDIDGSGANLLYLAHGFLKNINADPFKDDVSKQYLTITDATPSGVSIKFAGRYGRYGQSGSNVIDIQTGRTIYEFSDNDAFVTRLRNMIIIPDSSTSGLFLAERYAGRGLASIFIRELRQAFRAKFNDDKYTLRVEGLTNGEAWKSFLADARLTQLRIIRHAVPVDIADESVGKQIYNLTYTAKPPRGFKAFPAAVKDGILSGRIKAHEILGISPTLEYETRLEMEGDEWQKDFALDQKTPVLIYPVGTDDVRPEDSQMYGQMEDVVIELFPKLSVDLPSGWRSGTWPADALTVALEAVRAS